MTPPPANEVLGRTNVLGPTDVLGLGCVAVDDLLYVEQYPPPDGKQQVRSRQRQCGGLTATALVAAARLGAQAAYAGILGCDELSGFALERLAQEGVDLTHAVRREGVRPIHSTIVVDEGRQTRAIFYDLDGAVGADPAWPPEAVIRQAKVVFIDPLGIDGMIRAARIARQAGIPVVADFESDQSPRFAELLGLVDHLIVSDDFARRLSGESQPEIAARRLAAPGRTAVVTCGALGCWHAGDGGAPRHFPAFSVAAVDTTGCGDVFHGVYAAALARGASLDERLRQASAAAALKALHRGGQAGIPTLAAVERFLEARTPSERDAI